MKLGIRKGSKVTEPDYLGKLSFAQKWSKMAQNGPKMFFFKFCEKYNHGTLGKIVIK